LTRTLIFHRTEDRAGLQLDRETTEHCVRRIELQQRVVVAIVLAHGAAFHGDLATRRSAK
jgi:hypothetical protein